MINFAERAGLNASRLPDAFSGGFADSLPLQIFGARMAAREFEPVAGHMKTIQKDLDTATASARQLKASLPMATTASELVRLYGASHGEQDMSSLINLYCDYKKGSSVS